MATITLPDAAIQVLAKAALEADDVPLWAYAELCKARRAVGMPCPELHTETDPDGQHALDAMPLYLPRTP